MIRNDSEYKRVLQQIEEAKAHLHAQKAAFQEQGIPADSAELALQATETFILGLQEDAQNYDRAKRGELAPLHDLRHIGHWLISARIAKGFSQKELADRLSVSEAQVSRDERNEYSRISVERAQTILDTMGVKFQITEQFQHRAKVESEPYIIPLTEPAPTEFAANFRAGKKLSPEKVTQIENVLSAVFQSMVEDVPNSKE
ncbi:helix-turn-helix transcriptional regulator [Deinococcus saxicola]|uniref:helix-turn-helix domain-containing protein n=1 Tax=Deinococcus saxicola TaxID=249406 RepID=UPI0039EE74A1